MKTSSHRIITSDGLELAGLLYEPENKTEKILVHVHGMAGNFYENPFLDNLAKTLTDSGIAFFAFNNRGCEIEKDLYKIIDGKRSVIRIGNAYEIFEDSIFDIEAAMGFVGSKGFDKVHLSGHSLGSSKVAYYAAEQNDKRLSSVIFLSPADMVGLAKQEKNYENEHATAVKMVSEGKGHELIPFPVLWDESRLSARTYMSIMEESSKVAIFNFYNEADPLVELSKISIPSLTIMGRQDDALTTSIDSTMSRVKSALTHSPKAETIILGEANHGYDGYEQALADEILGWIQSLH